MEGNNRQQVFKHKTRLVALILDNIVDLGGKEVEESGFLRDVPFGFCWSSTGFVFIVDLCKTLLYLLKKDVHSSMFLKKESVQFWRWSSLAEHRDTNQYNIGT
jgi:hypothetical protein